ncbi:MAG: hypothetical protein AAF489_13030 [Bacteroidota bacterium]
MNLAKRLLFYFGGFAIGIILLYFFVGGSGASCEYDYGPTARTLKNIRLKNRVFTNASLTTLANHQLDTAAISILLKEGDVLFSESNTSLDSCKIYIIEGVASEKSLKISMENCEKEATVLTVQLMD